MPLYQRDLIGYNRDFRDDRLFNSVLQPPLYELSIYGYDSFYLQRQRRKLESWVLLQPEFKGIEI